MATRCAHILAVLVLLCGSIGCLVVRRNDYGSSQKVAVPDRSVDVNEVWQAAQETLRRHRFRLDRVDYRAGIITTMPVASQHFFEFWRHDVATWPDLWEATLNPSRRWVEVTMTRDGENSWNGLGIVVHKERLSSPDRQFNSTGAAYQYFGDSLPSTTGSLRVTGEEVVWLDQGRDPAMEEQLLHAILERARWSSGTDDPEGGGTRR